jgi:DNA polymerase-3 subunit delta
VSKSADMRKKLPAKLKKLAQTEVFTSFKDWEQDKVMDWIRTRGRDAGLTIERDAVFALESLGGNNLRHLSAEISKLSVYMGENKTVTKENVITVCEAGRGYFFKFQEAVRDRSTLALVYMEKMLDDGEEPVMLLGSVANQIRLFYQLLDLKQKGGSPQTIAKTVGKNPYYIQKLLPPVMKANTLAKLKIDFQHVAAADENIKLGKMRPRAAVETMLLGLVGGVAAPLY